MNKQEVVNSIIGNKYSAEKEQGDAFAPANIALCKYWGKRQQELNLPITNSLSISLGNKGAFTKVSITTKDNDEVYLGSVKLNLDSEFYIRLIAFLDLFRLPDIYFRVDTKMNIPVGAGVASSAAGFAAIVKALDDLFAWGLTAQQLSILARLGSGSASRSVYNGFVEWEAGTRDDGLDSFASPLPYTWPELRVGMLILSQEQKPISSRLAMLQTVKTSTFYSLWPNRVKFAIERTKVALDTKDFPLLGEIAEGNALEMHALMMTAKPPIIYNLPQTLAMIQAVWQARNDGVEVYFTQDAGPNLKLLFLEEDQRQVRSLFPDIEIIAPFAF